MELIRESNAVVEAALLRTQQLVDDAQVLRTRVKASGKNPARSRKVTTAEAHVSGALDVLAHILNTTGADVLVDGRPSSARTRRYLEKWDRQRWARALRRGINPASRTAPAVKEPE